GDEPDHERVTDLLTAFLGFGVIAANQTLEERYESHGNWSRWTIGRSGYLPAHVFGYALALFAWFRSETQPLWAGALRLDARTALFGGLKFLKKTGDSLFCPGTAGPSCHSTSVADLIAALANGTPGTRLSVLWDLRNAGAAAAPAVDMLCGCLSDDDG